MNNSDRLSANYRKKTINPSLKGKRKVVDLTFNPTSINSGEDLYIQLKTLPQDEVIIPGSRCLSFSLKNGNTESFHQNNLKSTLFKQITHKFNGEVYRDLNRADVINCYKDLWKKTGRQDMVQPGIYDSVNLRKLRSSDASGDSNVVADKLMFDVHSKRFSIPIDDDILTNHGPVQPFGLQNTHETLLKINDVNNVLEPSTGKVLPNSFTLENLKLRYETVTNNSLAEQVSERYMTGKSMVYEHVTLIKSFPVIATQTNIHETINLPRKSMRAVLLLFKRATDTSEMFYYPQINKCKIAYQGDPNFIYSQSYQKHDFFNETSRVFFGDDDILDKNVSEVEFFTDKFGLCIDLNTTNKSNVSSQGVKLTDTQNGLQLQIEKSTGTTACTCYLYCLSDGLLNIINGQLQSIQY